KYEIIDTPGIYSLEAESAAEQVAVKIVREADLLVNVIESTNLERNLNLTLQLIKTGKPMVVVLNFWDETKHVGVEIDATKLGKLLGVPVVTACAVTGEGIKDLVASLGAAKPGNIAFRQREIWKEIGNIIENVQKVYHKHHSAADRLADLTIQPLTGLPIAALILAAVFVIIRFTGESLITHVFDPAFSRLYMPLIGKLSAAVSVPFIRELLVGKTGEAMTSFGILTTGIYVPFVSVLPYILSFYLALSFLEDTGYLPRLAVLLDNIFHRFGMHGFSAVPIVLGLGCKVPALFSLRILASEREKILTAVLVLMAAPCMPQTAMIFSVGAKYGAGAVLTVFSVIFSVSLLCSFLLNKALRGEAPELFMEIPPYRMPSARMMFRKMWFRVRVFLFEAVPMIVFGVFVINVLDILGIIHFLSDTLGKATSFLMGVPAETGIVMVLGFLRKDMSISMLAPLNLDAKQFIIA
ncbi:MAG TPA: FeoB small GTPase domain-containing protein, partial [Candidatus Goldiibacteriota bacterium]|nr:FeoB small GTPase domain-containing protein [Candidatus Goldiibacteriota bacterium]